MLQSCEGISTTVQMRSSSSVLFSFRQHYKSSSISCACHPLRPLRHSAVHRVKQESFQAGTWCMLRHTVRRQASAHASAPDTPQTVTQELGVGSWVHGLYTRVQRAVQFMLHTLERSPIRRSSLSEVHTRSHTKLESPDSSKLQRMVLCFSMDVQPLLYVPCHAVAILLARFVTASYDFVDDKGRNGNPCSPPCLYHSYVVDSASKNGFPGEIMGGVGM